MLPQAGDVVWIRGRRWRVAGIRGDRDVTRLDVSSDGRRRTFLYPFDRPIAELRSDRPIRVRRQQARARLAALVAHAHSMRTLVAAVHAHADVWPHQLEPALAVQAGCRRILVADEVGLGKTVQAGVIAAEIQRRDPAARLLIVVPAALVDQWIAELMNRFGVACTIADRASLEARSRESAFGDNPWQGSGVWIASLDFLKQLHVLEAMPDRPWDLVVIDEAHAACGHSDRHRAADYVSRRARVVLLLTATPHSGDAVRFKRLLDIGRLASDNISIVCRRRADVGIAVRRRVAWHRVTLSGPEARVLTALASFERVVLRAAGRTGRDEARLLLTVLRKRGLSTMGALARSIDRRALWLAASSDARSSDVWRQTLFDFGGDDEEDELSADEREALTARTGLALDVERSWLKRLAHLVAGAATHDSKITRLASLLERSTEPAIVFTEFRDSLRVAIDRLERVRPAAVLHGGLSTAERSDALRQFRNGAASLLLATDVAGQGLNLHERCRWVVSLELPWNPARLEQRIGRVDRIGQLRSVHLTLLVARHDAETSLVAHLRRRVRSARQPMGDRALIDVPRDTRDVDHLISPSLRLCTRWRRHARRMARQIEARRALARRWRGPELAGRPRTSIVKNDARHQFLIFTIPFHHRSGELAERHVVAVELRRGCRITDELIEAARVAAARSLEARLRRARRLASAAASRASDVERAIADVIRGAMPRESQPGLFDARALHAFEETLADAAGVDAGLNAAIDRLALRAELEMGTPVLELMVGDAP